jgi:hypothetical protein
MPSVSRSETLALKDVSQVSVAPCTPDLYSFPVAVRDASDGPDDFLVKAGPAASGVKLVR